MRYLIFGLALLSGSVCAQDFRAAFEPLEQKRINNPVRNLREFIDKHIGERTRIGNCKMQIHKPLVSVQATDLPYPKMTPIYRCRWEI
jgi:hypothetical protein